MVVVGKKNMIKFVLTVDTIEDIENYEYEYMTNCTKIIQKYIKEYQSLGYEINYDIFWRKRNSGLSYQKRPFYDYNYECWFGYEVVKNGEIVCIDEIEGDTIGESYGFLFIKKRRSSLFKKAELEVTYINDLCDLETSLVDNLHTIRDLIENSGDGSLIDNQKE